MSRLVLSRRAGQAVVIDSDIVVRVEEVDERGQVRLSFVAPPEVSVWREELHAQGAGR